MFKAIKTHRGNAGMNDSNIIISIPNKNPPLEIISVEYVTILFMISNFFTSRLIIVILITKIKSIKY